MKINSDNKEMINNIDIHDNIFVGCNYSYKNRILFLIVNNFRNDYNIIFNNCIFYSMQSCDFWHGGNNILGINIVEESKEMNELLEIQNTYPGLYEGSFLDRGITYLSVEIEVNSGDKMLIICESIEI